MHYWKIEKRNLNSFFDRCYIGLLLNTIAISSFATQLPAHLPMSITTDISVNIPTNVIDASHVLVHLSTQPTRVVTLMPSLGELAADILANDLSPIVGVSEYTDYPPELKKKTNIGPYHQFNLESVVSLHPDLILASLDGNRLEQINHLRELGFKVVVVSTENFLEIENSMRLVALVLGKPAVGVAMAVQLEEKIRAAKRQSRLHQHVTVLLQLGDHPLVVAGRKSFLHSTLEMIGAENIYQDAVDRYPRPSIEDVLRRDPDVIVIINLGGELKSYQKMQQSWGQFKSLKAVKHNKVILFQSDSLVRPTIRMLESVSRLSKAIYAD